MAIFATSYFLILVHIGCTFAQESPENLRFVGAAGSNITIEFSGIDQISRYEISLVALYNTDDQHGWIITLPGGPTTSSITIDQITGLNRNILYIVRVAGIFDGGTGNSSEIIARTAPSGPVLTPGQVQPSLIVLYTSETPGATICQVGYSKTTEPGNENYLESEEACRVVIIRELDAATTYRVRARVTAAGGITFVDNEFGASVEITTAKLSLFGRVQKNEAYTPQLADPNSADYTAKEAEVVPRLLALYNAASSDVAAVSILGFDEDDDVGNIEIHHEIIMALPTMPASTAAYQFVDSEYTILEITTGVRPNEYSLVENGPGFQLSYNDLPTTCPLSDLRELVITDSITKQAQTVTVGELTDDRNTDPITEFRISGSELTTQSGVKLHSFSNNSASVITQQYLLRSCSDASSFVLFTKYYRAAHATTTTGFEDAFVHETDVFSFPGTTSTGINQGNGSKITFDRIPNAIAYYFTSGEANVTLDRARIDSSDQFFVRLSPVTPSPNSNANMQVTTQPYDKPKTKSSPIQISTMPSLPKNVRWPYSDRNNLTLTWDEDEGVLGYFITIRSERDTSTVLQEFESKRPEAIIGDLQPGQYYYVKVISYNYAGNATSTSIGYRLYTVRDPPVLSSSPLNVTDSQIVIEWAGGNHSILSISATSAAGNLTFDADVISPFSMTGLQPDIIYNVSVTATFDTGVEQSRYVIFRTDPSATTEAASTTFGYTTTADISTTSITTALASSTNSNVPGSSTTAGQNQETDTTTFQGDTTTNFISTLPSNGSKTTTASTEVTTLVHQSPTKGGTTTNFTITLTSNGTDPPSAATEVTTATQSATTRDSVAGETTTNFSNVLASNGTVVPPVSTEVSTTANLSTTKDSVTKPLPPAPVISPTLLEQNDTFITFEWQGSPGAASHDVEVITPTKTLQHENASSPYQIQYLYPDTDYTVTVTANHPDVSVDSDPVVFRTGPPTETPVLPDAAVNASATSLTIEWAGGVGAVSITVQVKTPDAKPFVTITGASSPLTISGLAPDTEYSVTVTAHTGTKNITGRTMKYATGSTATTFENSQTQPLQGEAGGLDWWVWLLIGVGAAAVLALAVIIIRVIILTQGGSAPPAENTIGVIKWLFGTKQKYVISKGPPPPVLYSEKFNNTD